MNWKVIGSFVSGGILLIAMLVVSLGTESTFSAWELNMSLLALGASFGWVVGIVISPYTSGEKTRLDAYAKVIGTFGSGYLLAKINPLVEHILDPKNVLDSTFGVRVALLLVPFIVVLVLVYVVRQYT